MENPGIIRWRGFSDEDKTYIAVYIKGKRYVFSHQGDGWVCEVDLNDPDIKEVIRRPNSQIEAVGADSVGGSLEDLLLNTPTERVGHVIENTTNVQWLLDAYEELTRMKQSTLAATVSERLKVLGVGTDGLPLGVKNEPKIEETQGVQEEEPVEAGEVGGDDVENTGI